MTTVGIALAYVVACCFSLADTPMLEPDSQGYITFSSMRTAGYPAFLALSRYLGLTLEEIRWVQLGLFASSAVCLANGLRGAFRFRLSPVFLLLLLFMNVYLSEWHFQILTESIFLSVFMLTAVFFWKFLQSQRLVHLSLASLSVGFMMAIRPASISFAVSLMLLYALSVRNGGVSNAYSLAAIAFPILAVLGMESAYYHSCHSERQSLAPRHYFAKAMMIDGSDDSVRADSVFVTEDRGVRRFIALIEDRNVRCIVAPGYEVMHQYATYDRVNPSVDHRTTTERILENLPSFLDLTFSHLYCLWTVGQAPQSDTAPKLLALRNGTEHVPYENEPTVQAIFEVRRIVPFGPIVRGILIVIFFVTLAQCGLGLCALIVPMEPSRQFAGLLAIGLHANLLFVASASIGIPRYFVVQWPALAILGIFAMESFGALTLRVRRNTLLGQDRCRAD